MNLYTVPTAFLALWHFSVRNAKENLFKHEPKGKCIHFITQLRIAIPDFVVENCDTNILACTYSAKCESRLGIAIPKNGIENYFSKIAALISEKCQKDIS
jgi:hypothetical protein